MKQCQLVFRSQSICPKRIVFCPLLTLENCKLEKHTWIRSHTFLKTSFVSNMVNTWVGLFAAICVYSPLFRLFTGRFSSQCHVHLIGKRNTFQFITSSVIFMLAVHWSVSMNTSQCDWCLLAYIIVIQVVSCLTVFKFIISFDLCSIFIKIWDCSVAVWPPDRDWSSRNGIFFLVVECSLKSREISIPPMIKLTSFQSSIIWKKEVEQEQNKNLRGKKNQENVTVFAMSQGEGGKGQLFLPSYQNFMNPGWQNNTC